VHCDDRGRACAPGPNYPWRRHYVDICGTAVFTGSQAAQLAWLREHEPQALERAATICHAKDWLYFRMTGQVTTDETDESLTMLRMSTRQYDAELFRILGIEDLVDKFPPVLPSEENCGRILPDVAAELGLPEGLTVGSGPMDVAACALGTGAIDHGQASTILGTAGIHQIIMDRPILEPEMVGMTLCHGVKGRWMRMLAAMTATPNLDWFLAQMGGPLVAGLEGANMYGRLEELIREVPAGSEGVMYHPYLFPGGERGPFVKPTARASFTGLNLGHSLKHMLRAVYEGVALATLDCYRHMPVEPDSVLLSGGGAKSDAWCQIIADCLGKPVSVPEGSQFGAKGAMFNAGVAVGMYDDVRSAVRQGVRMARLFEPNARNTVVYQELYEVYRLFAQRQMDLWDMRSRILKERP
jgi:erythritol kinase